MHSPLVHYNHMLGPQTVTASCRIYISCLVLESQHINFMEE